MGRIYEDHPRNESLREVSGLGSSPAISESGVLEASEELPEVFALESRSQRRVTARVQERRSARFRFMTDD